LNNKKTAYFHPIVFIVILMECYEMQLTTPLLLEFQPLLPERWPVKALQISQKCRNPFISQT